MVRSLMIITMVVAFAASQFALVACNTKDPRQTYEAAALAHHAISQFGEYWWFFGPQDVSFSESDLAPNARSTAESVGKNAANSAFDAAMEAIEGEFEYAVVVDAAVLSLNEYLSNEYMDENNEFGPLFNEFYDEVGFSIHVAIEQAVQVKSEAAERAGNAIVAAVDAAISAAGLPYFDMPY